MATNTENGNSGCFSSVVRRILCAGSHQTYPSDHITESNTTEFDHQKKDKLDAKVQVVRGSATPGIVARLMGLDSLPEANWIPKGKNPDSVARSRSVNFMEYLLEFDLTQANQAQHRRVRTSVSFREVSPSIFQQQNQHDFLLLQLDNAEKTKEKRLKARKSEVGFREVKQKEEKSKEKGKIKEKMVVKKKENQGFNKKISKLKNEPRRVSGSGRNSSKVGNYSKDGKDLATVLPKKMGGQRKSGAASKPKSSVLKPTDHNQKLVESKSMKKITNDLPAVNEVEPEYDSENSSPVSVLDVNEFSNHDEIHLSENSRPMDLTSRSWKSSPKTSNFDYPFPHLKHISNTNDLELREINRNDSKPVEAPGTDYCIEVAAKLCRLAEEEINESNWLAKEVLKFEDFEEICMEFEQRVLDQLLHQVIDELVDCTCKILDCNA